jgi:hypothetical protein
MKKDTLFDILLKVSELRMDIETAEKKIIETLLPTEEEIQTESDNHNFGWGWEDGFEFGAHWAKEFIKSRIAGKEE